MKNFVAEFYSNFKASYSQLTKKHRSQLKSLKAQHANSKLDSSNWPKAKQGFFNEKYDGEMRSSSEKHFVDIGGVKSDRVTALLH